MSAGAAQSVFFSHAPFCPHKAMSTPKPPRKQAAPKEARKRRQQAGSTPRLPPQGEAAGKRHVPGAEDVTKVRPHIRNRPHRREPGAAQQGGHHSALKGDAEKAPPPSLPHNGRRAAQCRGSAEGSDVDEATNEVERLGTEAPADLTAKDDKALRAWTRKLRVARPRVKVAIPQPLLRHYTSLRAQGPRTQACSIKGARREEYRCEDTQQHGRRGHQAPRHHPTTRTPTAAPAQGDMPESLTGTESKPHRTATGWATRACERKNTRRAKLPSMWPVTRAAACGAGGAARART